MCNTMSSSNYYTRTYCSAGGRTHLNLVVSEYCSAPNGMSTAHTLRYCWPAQDYCRAKLGKLDLAIKPRSFQEVQAHNSAGQCWLCLDGKPIKL